MNQKELADAHSDPKVRLRSYGQLLRQGLISLYPERDSLVGIQKADKMMIDAVGFLPLAEHLPKDLTNERAIVEISRIDGMLALIDVLLNAKESRPSR